MLTVLKIFDCGFHCDCFDVSCFFVLDRGPRNIMRVSLPLDALGLHLCLQPPSCSVQGGLQLHLPGQNKGEHAFL